MSSPTTPAGAALAPLPGLEQQRFTAVLAELDAGARRWAGTGLAERAALLRQVHASTGRAAHRWAATAAGIKGLQAASPLIGQEWLSGPYPVLQAASRLASSLEALAAGASPLDGLRSRPAPGGRVAVGVLPLEATERLLLGGSSAQVWLPPGVSAEQARADAGLGARRLGESGGVGLVLGASDTTSTPPLDALYELVAHNRAVLLTLDQALAAMMTSYLDALDPLVRAGVLRIVQGGAEVGEHLAHHAGVAHVHVTGSAAAHDAVVFGAGAQGARRRADGTPLLTKPVTSELGGVSPVIVVPGRWSEADLAFQAEHVATQRLHGGGGSPTAAQVVLISSDWPQKDAFTARLRRALDSAPPRPARWPAGATRSAGGAASHPGAERLGPDRDRLLLRTAPGDVDALAGTGHLAPVLGVLELPGQGQAFLDAAVALADTRLTGNLGAGIIVRPQDRAALGAGFDRALEALRYGTIAINTWTGLGFLTAAAPWGAFPGNTLTDVRSGIGVVHNALLIDAPERTVVQGPFRPFPRSVLAGEASLSPKPPWFTTARTAATTGRLLSEFAAEPSLRRLPGVLVSAFRG